jgi:hypothetical protein
MCNPQYVPLSLTSFKCDETRPICKSCAKRELPCSFTAKQSNLIVLNSSYSDLVTTPEVDEVTKNQAAIETQFQSLSHDEEISLAKTYSLKGDENDTLRLIHHYALSTSTSISDSQAAVLMNRDVIPALAFEHDFLLAGLLAVTSLHLAILNPCALHNDAALKHHSQALTLIRPHLLHITPDNVYALFSFSCMIVCYSFGIHKAEISSHDPLEEMLAVFTLLRGIAVIAEMGEKWLEQSPFASSATLPEPNSNTILEPTVEAALLSLSQRVLDSDVDPTSRDAYEAAIGLLRHSFLLSAEQPRSTRTALPFPIMVPQPFVEKLREREPLALVILAHYAVILHWLRHSIWLRNWGKEVVEAVRHVVGPEWHGCLEFNVEQVGSEAFLITG